MEEVDKELLKEAGELLSTKYDTMSDAIYGLIEEVGILRKELSEYENKPLEDDEKDDREYTFWREQNG